MRVERIERIQIASRNVITYFVYNFSSADGSLFIMLPGEHINNDKQYLLHELTHFPDAPNITMKAIVI